MAACQLRVYYGPNGASLNGAGPNATTQADTVTVALGEILPLLAEAVQSRRTWLDDFAADDVTISTDLYEVLLAYQHYRRPSA